MTICMRAFALMCMYMLALLCIYMFALLCVRVAIVVEAHGADVLSRQTH
jgi:hypothetical protein